MKIGVIYCAYNCISFVKESLQTFIEARQNNVISYIAAVSVPFFEYESIHFEEDSTTNFLEEKSLNKDIDILFKDPKFIKESEARNLCLEYLKSQDCDLIWIVDGDELYTIYDINNIINYINQNLNYYWYSINFKNYIFDGNKWIDGFCPPRIFQTNSDILNIYKFYWDNDILYQITNEKEKLINYKNLNFLEIPKNVAHVKHMTWLHMNGKNKYEYQMRHFGSCGYKWNETTSQLEFNYDFYLKNNQSIPQVYLDG
jgi:hypothetical protein